MNAFEFDDRRWPALSGLLQQALARGPLSHAAAQAVFEETSAEELSAEAVDVLIARALLVKRNGVSMKRNGAAQPNRAHSPRQLQHEPLERRDLLAPLFDWFCGAVHEERAARLPAAPRFTAACYAAAW